MEQKTVVGIIGAMASETAELTRRMTDAAQKTVAGRTFYTGLIGDTPAVVAESGIGKVAAAITAQLMIDRFHAGVLINSGMAGGLDPRLEVGDLVIGTAAVQHDFDITAFGHAPGYMGTGGDDTRPTAFLADERLVRLAQDAARQVLPGTAKAICGTVASGDVFVSDRETKLRLRDGFGAAAAEMEGAAVAQTAAANGVPFLILRTISDLADRHAAVSFEELELYAGRLAGDLTAALLAAR